MGVIQYQKKEDMVFEKLENGVMRAEMLPGMVDGVHTYKCQVKAGQVVELEVCLLYTSPSPRDTR